MISLMPAIYTQKNVLTDCGAAAYCSSLSAAPAAQETGVEEGATPGATEQTITISLPVATKLRAYYMQPTPAPSTDFDWNAGVWVVRINVTTAGVDIDWEDTHICRVNSGCVSQATIGSLLNQGISLGIGVKTMSVSGIAQTPAVGDSFMVVLGFGLNPPNTGSVGITPNQNLDTPLTLIPTKTHDRDLLGLIQPQGDLGVLMPWRKGT